MLERLIHWIDIRMQNSANAALKATTPQMYSFTSSRITLGLSRILQDDSRQLNCCRSCSVGETSQMIRVPQLPMLKSGIVKDGVKRCKRIQSSLSVSVGRLLLVWHHTTSMNLRNINYQEMGVSINRGGSRKLWLVVATKSWYTHHVSKEIQGRFNCQLQRLSRFSRSNAAKWQSTLASHRGLLVEIK